MTGIPERTTFTPAERDVIYRVMHQRRNIRHGLHSDPIPSEVLTRILAAAHVAPSSGLSKPWDFIIVSSAEGRSALQEMVRRRQDAHQSKLTPTRAAVYSQLRSQAITDTPLTVAVTCDPTTGGQTSLGANDTGENLLRSVGCAVENLWLAARAEHIGVCVSGLFDPIEAAQLLGVPPHMEVLLLLSLGYVDVFAAIPLAAQTGWSRGKPLAWAVHQERFGRRGLPGQPPARILDDTLTAIEPIRTHPGGDQLSRLAALTGQPVSPLAPAALVLFVAGGADPTIGPSAEAITTTVSAANRFAEAAEAQICVIDVAPAGANPVSGPLGPEFVQQAIELGIGTARDLFTSGNCCLAGEIITPVPGQPSIAHIVTTTVGASSGEIYAVLAAENRPDLAALVGFILGARALRLPVLLSGDTGAAAAALATHLHPDTIDACFHVTRTDTGQIQVYTSQPRPAAAEPGLTAAGISVLADL